MRRFSLVLLALGLVLATASEDFSGYDDVGNTSNSSTTHPTHVTSHAPTTQATNNVTSHAPTTQATNNVTTNAPTHHVTPAVTTKAPSVDDYIVYQLHDEKNTKEFCFKMNTSISVIIGTDNITKQGREAILRNQTFFGNLTDKSFCSVDQKRAEIYLEDTRVSGIILAIFLNATDKQTWSITDLQFEVDESFTKENETWTFEVDGKDAFPFSQDVGYERFFRCKHSFYVNFTILTNGTSPKAFYPSYFFKNLQLQAFQFKNKTSGEFVNGVTCQAESNQGNKIVPIAVGAALAGLVVVVLIAYIIGRLRSRRQSYEPLS